MKKDFSPQANYNTITLVYGFLHKYRKEMNDK